MNTLKAVQVMTNDAAWTNAKPHIKEVVLRDHDTAEFRVKAVTNEPLRTTICWTDPCGKMQPYALNPTNIVLVNDLDLRVIEPSGSVTNMPWVLNPTNPSAPATTGDNIRDNVEQVHIANPVDGWYTVRISHKGSLSNGMQDVSIIVSGNMPTNPPLLRLTEIAAVSFTNTLIGWDSVVGALYRIESCSNLVQGAWTNDVADDLSGTNDVMTWIDTIHSTPADRVRFYRVKAVQ